MEGFEIERMWEINSKACLGDYITDYEKQWFDERLQAMKAEMEANWSIWQKVEKFNK